VQANELRRRGFEVEAGLLGPGGGVFNVENVGGKVRFVDGQPTPPVPGASHYFDM
jgi:hypothetical protein